MVADWFIMFYVKMIAISAILILLQIHIFAKCCLPLKGLDFQNTKAVYLCFIGWNGLANICIHPGMSQYELARFNVYAMKHRNLKGLFLKWSINENLLRCASFDIISCRASYIRMVILKLAVNLSRYIIYAGHECLEIPYNNF